MLDIDKPLEKLDNSPDIDDIVTIDERIMGDNCLEVEGLENEISAEDILSMLTNKEVSEKLTDNEFKLAFDMLVHDVCQELGINDEPKLIINSLDDSCFGLFDKEYNRVIINGLRLDNKGEVVDTLLHELRHAYQQQCINLPEDKKDDYARLMTENDRDYILPQDDYSAYLYQPLEYDAITFSANYLEEKGFVKGDFNHE